MSEELKEQARQETPLTEAQMENVQCDGSNAEKVPKKKMSIMKLAIIGAIIAAAVIVAIIVIPSKFERVENKCVKIAGMAETGKNYFSLCTEPIAPGFDSSYEFQKKNLEAIKYANEELGFPGSVYSEMMDTTALMGRQSEENNKYKVTWTYHPDDGLKVTYSKK